MSRIIALTSGKGGVGKSHVSVNLALQCARAGLRICLVDADPGPASAHDLLSLAPRHSFAEVLAGHCQWHDTVQSGFGIDIVPGGIASEHPDGRSGDGMPRLHDVIRILAQYDLIFLNIPSGAAVAEKLLAFAVAAPEVLLIITPEPSALTDAYALVKRLQGRRYAGRIQLVVSQAHSERQAVHTYEKFREVVRVYQGLDLALLGAIPADTCTAEPGSSQTPPILRPDSCAGLALAKLAARLLQDAPAAGEHDALSEYWSRLTGREIAPLAAAAACPDLSMANLPPPPAGSVVVPPDAIDTRLEELESQLAQVRALLDLNALAHSTQLPAAREVLPADSAVHGAAQPESLPTPHRRRLGEAPQGVRGLRTTQRATPIDALQLRRVVGRMLVKAMPGMAADSPLAPEPVQIAVDQIQLAGDNEFSLRPGRYTRISLHCAHIQSPDRFIEEIFSNCAITGCKVQHLGSHVRYWVTSGRDGCILLDGDVGDRNCVQVYMAAGGNSPLEAVGSELEATLPRLRRVSQEGDAGAAAPALLLSKFPHERLPQGEGAEGVVLYRLLRRDREPLLCAFHRSGDTSAQSVRSEA